ncbi:MAG: TonB-dependent receptor [Saprospiraceae bacterium]|nr:TonB-dependent receptor [Saprospiraceae bacterium]
MNSIIKLIILCIITSTVLNAQTELITNNDTLSSTLDEVIYSVHKNENKRKDVPNQINIISRKDIQFLNPQSSADMLINSGAVFVQKSQQGGGSPNLRGFEASRVLIVIDGIRMNNAIYRAGHLQDVITIDNNLIDRTEVLFGPSSTIYGSDALGGVMHFYTRKPVFKSEANNMITANAYTRWSSANNESTTHLDINLAGNRFSSLSGITYSNFGDLRSGKNRNPFYDSTFFRREYVERINGVDSIIANDRYTKQIFSGYKQFDLFQKLAFKQNKNITHTLNLQYSTSSDIPRYDRLTEYRNGRLRFAEWYYGPQSRFLGAIQSEIKANTFFNKMNISLAFQDIGQDRISRSFRSNNRTSQLEQVKVYSINVDAHKLLNPKNELNYGLELVHNRVNSEANTYNIITDSISSAVTRYPDGGSQMSSIAAYFSHLGSIGSRLKIQEGIRYSLSSLKAKFVNKQFFPFPFNEIEQNNNSLTGNLGLVFNPCNSLRISGMGSTGFRTPNVDDLTKIFESSKGILIVSNPDLKPEYTINVEAGIEYQLNETHTLSLNAWNTWMDNAMVLKNYKYEGKDSIDYLGTLSQVQALQNVNKAFIRGLSASYKIQLSEKYSFNSSITYTYGRYKEVEKDTLVPLDHISPVFGRTGLSYNEKNFQYEIYALYNGWKRIKDYSPSGEDNLQYATSLGMPSWATINFKASYSMCKNLTIQAGIENILDTHYRYFASGISAPGRNVYITLRGKI